MSFKVIKNASGEIMGWGTNDEHYDPCIPAGCTVSYTDIQPTQPPILQPTYRQLRAAAYPPPADYLDAWVKNDTFALEAYRSACLAVKTKYPKV